jgi:hypothetical protein
MAALGATWRWSDRMTAAKTKSSSYNSEPCRLLFGNERYGGGKMHPAGSGLCDPKNVYFLRTNTPRINCRIKESRAASKKSEEDSIYHIKVLFDDESSDRLFLNPQLLPSKLSNLQRLATYYLSIVVIFNTINIKEDING